MTNPAPSSGGQTPPGDGSTPGQTPATGQQTPNQPQNDDDAPMTVAEARKLREELKSRRLTQEATQAELKKLQDAQLSESERQTRKLAELQAEQSSWQVERQRMILERAVEREASSLFNDPEDAMHYLDLAEVEYDENGRPKNLAKVLKNLAADLKERGKTHLLKSEQQTTPQPSAQPRQSIGASNPSRSQTSGSANLSWELIGKMTPQEFAARNADGSVDRWMTDNPIRRRR